jgi:thymidylate synthase (FAD)
MNEVDVFGDGKSFVKLVDVSGDDLSIVNAARVSFAKESQLEKIPVGEDILFGETMYKHGLSERDQGLLNFLMKNKHGTPFEMAQFHFHIRAPLFVNREWFRHRIGSFNEESGRYVELRPHFYYPENFRRQEGKPGAYFFAPWQPETEAEFNQEEWLRELETHCISSYELYKEMLEAGIAKEQARIILPLNLYSEFRWSINARALMNFLSLRNNEHAMWEIKEYATQIEAFFLEKLPVTWQAFQTNGRVAP